jgi:probable rRNA maturation factor
MKKQATMSPDAGKGPGPLLSLSVQYATEAGELPRWRLRRWVRLAVDGVAASRVAAQKAARKRSSRSSAPHAPLTAVALALRLVDADEGRALNREFRGKDYATNVLTFEYGTDPDGQASGDIVLCVPVLRREADEQGKPLLAHAAHLVIHGVLHALGYDHLEPVEAEEMEALEIAILARMGLPDPYQ